MDEFWWSTWSAALTPYAVLLRAVIDQALGPDEFEVVFLKLYKSDATPWPPDVFAILDKLFAEVDDYCADPILRSAVGGIGADILRERCAIAFAALEAIGSEGI